MATTVFHRNELNITKIHWFLQRILFPVKNNVLRKIFIF